MGSLTGTLSPNYRRILEREPAGPHFNTIDTGRPASGGEAPQPRALPDMPGRFEVYRADEFRTSSTMLAGGDWRWRLADAAGLTLVEGGGYRSEGACRQAVALLRRHVPRALSPTRD